MALLKGRSGSGFGQKFKVAEPRCVLGRQSDCHIYTPFLGLDYISRHHAAIEKSGNHYVLRDLGSRHGTHVNGMLVCRPVTLRHGDRLALCDVEFDFLLYDPVALTHFIDEAGSSSIDSTMEIKAPDQRRVAVGPPSADVRLQAIVEMLAGLGRSLDPPDVLQNLLDALLRIFPQAEHGFVGLCEGDAESVVPAAVIHRHEDEKDSVRVSRTIVRHVLSTGKAVRSTDVEKDPRFKDSDSIHVHRIRSVMCVPLVDSDGAVLGVAQVDSASREKQFTHQDLEVMVAASCMASVALGYTRLHRQLLEQQANQCDLAMARRVQTNLLPHQPPQIPGYRFFEFYRAAYNVGGDYYDYVPLPGDRVAVVVADASGKGVSGALMASTLSGELKFWLGREPSPGAAVRRVNARIVGAECEGSFVTLAVAVIDPHSHQMTVVNAGHMEPLLRRPDGAVQPIGSEAKGLPLGIEPNETYSEARFELAQGETVVMFSDGFNEAMNHQGELFGLDRVTELVAEDPGGVTEIGHRIVREVERFVGTAPQRDDMCLTCFGRA